MQQQQQQQQHRTEKKKSIDASITNERMDGQTDGLNVM